MARYTQLDRLCSGLAMAAATLAATPSFAQSASESASVSQGGLEEIVVTATRREERLQNVPVAVTALTSQALEQRQINDVQGLQNSTPTLNMTTQGDRSSVALSLRGQSTNDNVSSIDPAVGVYLDGVYIARTTGGNLNFIDVERVEVLRGPQGTLFGRNTIGGAVNITTKLPTDAFEGSISAGYGNYNAWNVTTIANLPITEGIAFRAVGYHSERDGFARSTITGAKLNGENIDYVRGALSFDLSSSWNLTLTGDYTHSKNDGTWITLLKALPAADARVGTISRGMDTASNYVDRFATRVANTTDGPNTSENWGFGATITGEIGAVHVKSITSYREMHRFLPQFDQDGTPYELLQLTNKIDQNQFSQEVQFYGNLFDDRLDWIVGAYYFEESAVDRVDQHFGFPINANWSITNGFFKNKSASIFGQLEFHLSDQFSVVAGARYVKDTREITWRNRVAGPDTDDLLSCLTAGGVLPTCAVTPPKAKFDYVPFTLDLNYKATGDILLYGKFSRGFRAGGFNSRANAARALSPFGPERVDSYELGLKADIAQILRFNAAVFQSEFSNIQFTTAQPDGLGGSTLVIDNAGKARIKGVEVEAVLSIDRLRLNANLGVIDAKYTQIEPTAVGITKNSKFPYTPKVTYGFGASYSISTGFGGVELNADYSWRTKIAYALTPPQDPANIGEAYGLLNGKITLRLQSGIEVSAWGKNLTNKRYVVRITDLAAAGFLNNYPGDPRTYGVTARYRF